MRYAPLAPLLTIFLVTTERAPRAPQPQRRSDLQRPAVPHGRGAGAGRVRDPPVQPRQLRAGARRGAAGDRRDPARPELAVGSARRLRRHRPGHEPLLHERGHAVRALDAQPRQPRRSGARPRPVREDRCSRHGRPALGERHRLADRDRARDGRPHHAPRHGMPPGPVAPARSTRAGCPARRWSCTSACLPACWPTTTRPRSASRSSAATPTCTRSTRPAHA